jgi:phosphate transport system substrate-binding protein
LESEFVIDAHKHAIDFMNARLVSLHSLVAGMGLVAVALSLWGCGGGGESGDGLSGAVRVDGSSTVFPLTEAVAEEFMREHRGVRVTVSESGTGGGFSKFLRGETDINDASRPITPAEREKAQANGVDYIEVPVGYDGIAVVTHPNVDWVDCLTVEELRRIWSPDDPIDSWSEVRDGFPDAPIELYGPGTASGTYDYFTEAVVGEAGASRSDFTASEDDNVLVQGVRGTQGALGYFGFAYYENNADALNLVAVDPDERGGEKACTAPSDSTIQTGTYTPLARPLYTYVRADAADRPAVETFIEFYLNNAGSLAPSVGYVGLSPAAYDLALQRFRNRVTGTLFGTERVRSGADVEAVLRRAAGDTTSTAAPASESPPSE